MVIDTSALVALLLRDEGSAGLQDALVADPVRLVSAATLVETGIVMEARLGDAGGHELERLLRALDVEIVPVDAAQAEEALSAWRRYGKGRHAAALNFGDVFAYALARQSGEPLLFTGADFARTDVGVAG